VHPFGRVKLLPKKLHDAAIPQMSKKWIMDNAFLLQDNQKGPKITVPPSADPGSML
jgi:hypothetical protein